MSSSLEKACESLIEIKDQFEESDELVQAILERDNAEDLLIAVGMAIAYSEDAITLNKKGEAHLIAASKELDQIIEELEEGDE